MSIGAGFNTFYTFTTFFEGQMKTAFTHRTEAGVKGAKGAPPHDPTAGCWRRDLNMPNRRSAPADADQPCPSTIAISASSLSNSSFPRSTAAAAVDTSTRRTSGV